MSYIKLVRCTKDSETFTTKNGKSGLQISFCFDIGYGDSKSTTWCKGVMWGDRAGKLADYLKKGKQFVVKGEDLKPVAFEGKNGLSASLEMTVVSVELVADKAPLEQAQAQHPVRPQPSPNAAIPNAYEFNDDIDF